MLPNQKACLESVLQMKMTLEEIAWARKELEAKEAAGTITREERLRMRMHQRVDKRSYRIHRLIETYIEHPVVGGEEDRLWLEQYAVGTGLDIACGDFLIGMSIGIDKNNEKLGQTWVGPGDTLYRFDTDSMDYIVSNYFECFPDPSKVLREWHRVLKPGGTLAIVVANAVKYVGELGLFCNEHRLSAFTEQILSNHLHKAQFHDVNIELNEKQIRARCLK